MRSGENREVGFVINQIANPFNAEVISGVSDLLEANGYLTSVLDAGDDISRQGRHLESFIRGGRGGLLWLPALDTPTATFDLLKAHNIATVTFLRRTPSHSFDHVGVRNAEATGCATRHLIDLGHKHIAYLGGDIMTDVRQERIAGYCAALIEAGLAPPVIWDSEDNKRAGMIAAQTLRATHPEITGIVCNGDMVALGACLALQRDGQVPGEAMSIVGFDDIQDAAVATPPLTSMAVSPYELGRRLARVLLERIQEPDAPLSTSEISAELVIRGTTGPII